MTNYSKKLVTNYANKEPGSLWRLAARIRRLEKMSAGLLRISKENCQNDRTGADLSCEDANITDAACCAPCLAKRLVKRAKKGNS